MNKRPKLKGTILVLAATSTAVLIYLAGLMVVIWLEQGILSFLQLRIGGYCLHLLGPSYIGIVAGYVSLKYRRIRERARTDGTPFEEGEPPRKMTISIESATARRQVFFMATFTLAMELLLTYRGPISEIRLLIAGLCFLVLWLIAKQIVRYIIRGLIKSINMEK